jgi:hypothetical protein
MPNKPSGTTGPIKMTHNSSQVISISLEKIVWETNQKGIEKQILQFFIRDNKEYKEFLSYEDGGTEELDFLIKTPKEKFYLELMEAVAPEDPKKLFQQGNQFHKAVDYVDKVFAGVERKIKKYGLKHKVPIELLIYTTHEQYNPNVSAIELLKHKFSDIIHPFRKVFFLTPIASDFSDVNILFNQEIMVELKSYEQFKNSGWGSIKPMLKG